jgi:rhodopsin domain-containing protein
MTTPMALTSRKMVIILEEFYVVATGLTKVSILCFYRRLAAGSMSKSFIIANHICIAFVVLSTIGWIFPPLLGCQPLNAWWNQVDYVWATTHIKGKDWHCFNEPADLLTASVFSVVQDFIACLMPTILFRRLQLPFRQKVALSALFGIGIL